MKIFRKRTELVSPSGLFSKNTLSDTQKRKIQNNCFLLNTSADVLEHMFCGNVLSQVLKRRDDKIKMETGPSEKSRRSTMPFFSKLLTYYSILKLR